MVLDQAYQSMVANGVLNSVSIAVTTIAEDWGLAARELTRPCVVFRPTLTRDGDKWCALFGDDLQDGVAGFGDTPKAAMLAFDAAWENKKLK